MRTLALFIVVLACGACGGAPAKERAPSSSMECETLLEAATAGGDCLALRTDACWSAGTCGEPRTTRCKGLLTELEQKCDDRAK